MIVQPDSDVADVARRCLPAAFSFAGQSRSSVQQLLVHRAVHDELVDALAAAAEDLVVGDPLDEGTDVGPLIADVETERVRSRVDAAAGAGARAVAGGTVTDGLLRPTIIDGVDTGADVWRREVFGPVLAVRSYDDVGEAFALANDSDYGLHAGVFTNELSVALRAVRELDVGGVLVNEMPTFQADQPPYGGVRDAGNTREGPAYAIEEMTNLRFVSLQP